MGCVWGIEKFFDEKSCLKHFRKNFKIQSEDDKNCHIKLEGLYKGKNKNFYVVKFTEDSLPYLRISYDNFNMLYGKNKKLKLRPVQEGMNTSDFYFISIENVSKRAEKNSIEPTEQ
jgi:hypothetical protein